MPNEKVGTSDSMTIKKETVKEGKVKKTEFFFPSLGVTVEAQTIEEAEKLAKKRAK